VIYNGSGVPMQLTDSDIATLNCPHLTGTFRSFNASQTLTETLSIGAFWTGADASQPWENATYSPFSPGNYTIVAFDPWGQLAEFNFTVISGTASSTSTGTSSTVSTQNTTIITTAVDLGAAPNVQILNSSITAASSSTVTVLFNVSSSAQGTFYVTIATAGTQVLGLSFVQSWNPPPLPAGVSVSFGGLSVANGGTVTKGGDNATIQGVDHFLVPVTITLSDVPSGALKLEIIVFETQGSPPTSIGAIQTFQVTVS
jgi:hypothetical protein